MYFFQKVALLTDNYYSSGRHTSELLKKLEPEFSLLYVKNHRPLYRKISTNSTWRSDLSTPRRGISTAVGGQCWGSIIQLPAHVAVLPEELQIHSPRFECKNARRQHQIRIQRVRDKWRPFAYLIPKRHPAILYTSWVGI